MCRPTLLLIGLLVLVIPACTVEDEQVATTTSALECPDIACGNAAHLGAQPFWELDRTKLLFSPVGGFRIKSFELMDGTDVQLGVAGFELFGVTATRRYRRQELEGSKLVIESIGMSEYELTIEVGGVGSIPFMEGGFDPHVDIPTYRWHYTQTVAGGGPAGGPSPDVKFLCPSDNIHAGAKYSIVFEGDRYDKATGTVIATGADAAPWFNIACLDDALWKMAVFRHVEAATGPLPFHTSPEDRNAALRAIRADYCGNNEAWTETGTEVDWANWAQWLSIDHSKYSKVEAIWDENGAICLSHPRLYRLREIDCWPFLWRFTKKCTQAQIDDIVAAGGRMITYVP